MRKSNKVISAMLSVLMVSGMFTAMPLAVNAAGTADTNETTTSAAVQSVDETQSDSEEKEYNDFTYYTYFNEGNNRIEAVITGYKGADNDLVIPDAIDNVVVTSIGEKAFYHNSNLTTIIISDNIINIGSDAFLACSSLTKVVMGNNVGKIGYRAFALCNSLSNITLPDSVKSIENIAFAFCEKIKNIRIPDGIESIGERTFLGCEMLLNIEIPYSIKTIGDSAFDGCYDLSNVLYTGDKNQWKTINIGDKNSAISDATIHYNAKYVETIEPSCKDKGFDLYYCSECTEGVKINLTDALGHNFVNGVCQRCGKAEADCLESAHPYDNNIDKSWTIFEKDATRITITFSHETETEPSGDYIYIYDANGEEVGRYSGDELSDKTITILGDTVKIRLVTNTSLQYYGFDVSEVVPHYDICPHSSTEIQNKKDFSCNTNGYTGDLICKTCGAILKKGEIIPATGKHDLEMTVYPPTCSEEGYTSYTCKNCGYSYTDDYIEPTGNHEYIDGVCKICGAISLENLPSISGNETQNVIIEDTDVRKYFKFTPSQSGSLTFYSTGSSDTFGRLYDSDMTALEYNDDNGEDRNFRISYNVNAGETYVLQIGAFNSSDEAFSVTFNFEPNKETLLGDVNGDGEITVVDATIIQKYIVGLTTLDDETLNVADVNKDGAVTVVDATLIQKFIVKLITEF